MKVRVKAEIVTMGQPDVDPTAATGHYVEPRDWNALIAAPDVAVIDTRNAYEVAIGSFEGAIDPGTESFRDFPAWWAANGARFEGKRIAMYCTGGIRCEKSTSFLLGQGVEEVFHLKGGILKYLEEVPETQSLWRGQCFVFDGRVSVGHGLRPGGMSSCGACGRALSDADCTGPDFERGVSAAFVARPTATPTARASARGSGRWTSRLPAAPVTWAAKSGEGEDDARQCRRRSHQDPEPARAEQSRAEADPQCVQRRRAKQEAPPRR